MIYRYDFPDQFAELEQTDFTPYSGKLVLWGAGKIGSVVAHVLKQKGIKALAFVDISPAKQGTSFCGLNVVSPEVFLNDYKDSELIVTTVGREDVIAWLTEQNFVNWHDAWPLLLEFDFGDYSEQNQMYMVRMINYYFRILARSLKLEKKYFVDRIRFVVTSRCTLRCKECNMFVPYLQRQHDDDWGKIVSDIKIFLDAVGEIHEIELFGGEPLLYPDLDKIVSALKNESRIKQISVITNGTLLIKTSLLQMLKSDPRVIVRMSNYGELSTKIEEMQGLLQENGIRHEIMNYKTWYKGSEIKVLDESEEELRRKFVHCMDGCGMISWQGKLHLCSTVPFLIEEHILPESSSNFYDMRDCSLDRQVLLNGICEYVKRGRTDQYIDACHYCNEKTSTHFRCPVPVAEQVGGILKLPEIIT